jgi:cell division septation protein DedD
MKLRALTGAVLVGVVSVTLVAGCSRERIDWKSAEAADTQESYNHFLERHPDSALATQARARLAQLAEDKDWQRASAADTADAYKQFLAQHPSGKWAEEARIRVENFSLDSNPSPVATPDASATASSVASTAPAQRTPSSASAAAGPGESAQRAAPAARNDNAATRAAPPPGPPSKPAPVAQTSPATSSDGYGIQLGAFSTQAAALSEWKRLQTAHDAELHGLFAHAVPVEVTSGKLFRLQSPVGDEARARAICTSLTKHQTPCVVVLPPEKR